MKLTSKQLADFVENKAVNVSSAYMWGEYGRTITEQTIAQKAKQYPARYSKTRQKYLSTLTNGYWIGCDCVGLIKWFLWTDCGQHDIKYDKNTDLNVTGFKRKCTGLDSIKDIPEQRGLLVFMSGHVGVYLGEGAVGECTLSSRGDGIVISDIETASWVEFGRLSLLDYGKQQESEPISVGDVVQFTGSVHYSNGFTSAGLPARKGPARVTHYRPNYRHPYHIIHTDTTSNVYGWVDSDTIYK